MHQHAFKSLALFALAATCGFAAFACAGCSTGESGQADAANIEQATETETTSEGRTILLPDWYFNNTSDEDVMEILINAGCTSAERSGESFAVTMPEAYAEAFVDGMKGEVHDIVDELAETAASLNAAIEADEELSIITLTMPAETYATEDGSNLALNTQAAAAAAYVYRSAADLGTCSAVVLDESGAELARATLPDDHEKLLTAAEQ